MSFRRAVRRDSFSESHQRAHSPAIGRTAWREAEARAGALVRQATGSDVPGNLLAELKKRDGARMLAIGGAAAALAIELALHGPSFELTCIDDSPEPPQAARERAAEIGLKTGFLVRNLDTVELEAGSFDL